MTEENNNNQPVIVAPVSEEIVAPEEMEHRVLGLLNSRALVREACKKMKYGRIVRMTNWCARQGNGVDPPWHFYKVPLFPGFRVPIPFFSLLVIFIMIIVVGNGVGARGSITVTITIITLLLLGSFVFSVYEYNSRGKCHICGGKADARDNVYKTTLKGEAKKKGKGGLCRQCDWNCQRFWYWKDEEHDVWHDHIKPNRISSWFVIPREYTDVRPNIGTFHYRHTDRKQPRDVVRKEVIRQGKNTAMELYNLFDDLDKGRYSD